MIYQTGFNKNPTSPCDNHYNSCYKEPEKLAILLDHNCLLASHAQCKIDACRAASEDTVEFQELKGIERAKIQFSCP